jgi:hypothetical protein
MELVKRNLRPSQKIFGKCWGEGSTAGGLPKKSLAYEDRKALEMDSSEGSKWSAL